MRRVASSVGFFKAIIWRMKRLAAANSVSFACWQARFPHLNNHPAERGDPGGHHCLETLGHHHAVHKPKHECLASTDQLPQHGEFVRLAATYGPYQGG